MEFKEAKKVIKETDANYLSPYCKAVDKTTGRASAHKGPQPGLQTLPTQSKMSRVNPKPFNCIIKDLALRLGLL